MENGGPNESASAPGRRSGDATKGSPRCEDDAQRLVSMTQELGVEYLDANIYQSARQSALHSPPKMRGLLTRRGAERVAFIS
jgi:hypothetical protein